MTTQNSWDVFEQLLKSPGPVGLYRAKCIGVGLTFLGASASGEPTFLIPVPASASSRYIPPISLAGLEVNFGCECKIRESGADEKHGTYVVLQCSAKDALAKQCFVRMLYPAVLGLGQNPSFSDIRALVDTASQLFSQSDARPESVRGLWGELFVLSRASDIQKALSFWRVQDIERYDFSDGDVRLEVKTALGVSRTHTFSLEQLRPVDGVHVVVASVLLQPSAGGVRLSDLVESIGMMLDPQQYRSLLSRVNATLRGAAFQDATLAFDARAALASLRFFLASKIPSIDPVVPPQVTGVRFNVDISGVEALAFDDASGGLLGLFRYDKAVH